MAKVSGTLTWALETLEEYQSIIESADANARVTVDTTDEGLFIVTMTMNDMDTGVVEQEPVGP